MLQAVFFRNHWKYRFEFFFHIKWNRRVDYFWRVNKFLWRFLGDKGGLTFFKMRYNFFRIVLIKINNIYFFQYFQSFNFLCRSLSTPSSIYQFLYPVLHFLDPSVLSLFFSSPLILEFLYFSSRTF